MASQNLVLVVLSAALAASTPSPAQDCTELARQAVDNGLLQLDFEAFDQDMEGGWRPIGDAGCHAEAARLIDRYLEESAAAADRGGTLAFHAGQMYAFAGDYETAIDRFERSFQPDEVIAGLADSGDEEIAAALKGWNLYVLATVAFLQRDRDALLGYRDEMAAVSADPGTTLNLGVVDRFIEHFDRSYAEAYLGQPQQ